METAAHQQWPLRRAWLLQEPPRSFLGSGELPCVPATSPSPVRVGTPAWGLEAGLWGPPSGRPRQGRPEGARAWPGTRRPAAEAKCEACSAACWPSSERPPLWLPERSRGLGQSRSQSSRPVSRSPLQVSPSRCDSGPDSCLSIAALRGRASPSKPRTEPLASPGPPGSCSAGLLCLSLGNADGAPARGDWRSGHKTAPCFAVTGLPTTGQGCGSRGALAGGEISTSQCYTRSLQWSR